MNRILTGVMIALIVAFVASTYVYRQLQRAAAAKPIALGQVVVAAEPLPLGARLQAKSLRLAAWPADNPLPGTFTRVEDCVDRALVTQIVENEPVLEQKLAPKQAGAGLPAVIPEGMRALTVRVDDVVGVAGFVMPGTMVDVLVTGGIQGGAGGSGSLTRTILEDLRVLAAGQQVEQDKEGKPHTVQAVTLLLNPEQTNKLTMASTEGKIQLALRNTIDTKQVNPPPVTRASLFQGETPVRGPSRRATPPTTPPPPPAFIIEIIRGDKRETHTFPAQ